VRSLDFLDVMMIGIAGLVGGAIFVLTGPAIGLAGGSVIIAFIINAIITLFTAMGYAELGSAIPEAVAVICGSGKDYQGQMLS
jgi:basic amino acid/polyamine antiporter, APA family